jgi:hypothetical protein
MAGAAQPTSHLIEMNSFHQPTYQAVPAESDPTERKTHCYALPVIKRVAVWTVTTAGGVGMAVGGMKLMNSEFNPATTNQNSAYNAAFAGFYCGLLLTACSGVCCILRTICSLARSNCCTQDLDAIDPGCRETYCCGKEVGCQGDCCC